jgi:hypothetical protein
VKIFYSVKQHFPSILVCIFFCQILNAQIQKSASITGTVIDAVTERPISFTNVYISGTTFGSATSESGEYEIKNVPPGMYRLIFQHINYEISVKDFEITTEVLIELNVELNAKILESEKIEVISKSPREWRRRLETFTEEFIGKSDNADNCKILNPEVLEFDYNPEEKKLVAYTDSLLHIENRSLGYKIEVVLERFIAVKNEFSRYRIYPKFVLLEPENEKEQIRWEKNRFRTYRGSCKHFLSTLAREKLKKEHFTIYRGYDIRGLIRGFGDFLTGDELKIEPMDSPLYKKFYLDSYLSIRYGDRYADEPGIITFNQDYVIIDTLGNVVTQFIVLKGGEWSNEGISDLLPTEYFPIDDLD